MPFRDVIGHRRLIGLLARAILRDSLPPSLILAGPSGIGKRLVAVATAQALNCDARRPFTPPGSAAGDLEGLDACGVCSTCTRIARGVHPDILIVEPGDSGSIKTEQVRELIDRAAYRPFEGHRRAVIIDEADALVPAAQNALLKTLEEPPSSSVFLLVTARPDALLPTVRSRSPRLRFWPLGADEVAAVLIGQGQTGADAHTIAATAAGSVERALEVSAGGFGEGRAIAARALVQAAGSDDVRRRLESAKALVGASAGSGAADRKQLAAELRAMASLIRDAELLATGADRRALANPDVLGTIESLSAYRGERGVRAFAAVDEALAALDGNSGVKIVADWLMMRL
jgi:DNA polymerase-3 subunit delta'